jgi:hypothetical protein
MRSTLAVVLMLVAVAPAGAANHAHISAQELAAAVNRAGSQSVPYRQGKLLPYDVRSVRCEGPDEEPTEFQCSWRQRTPHGWVKRQTWLAIDGKGWHVID